MKIKINFVADNSVTIEDVKYFLLDPNQLFVKILRTNNESIDYDYCYIDKIEIIEDKKDESPEDPADALPWSMNQYRTVVDAIIELASVSGDLSILANNPKLEMSGELREQLEELVYQLKRFNESFTFEF